MYVVEIHLTAPWDVRFVIVVIVFMVFEMQVFWRVRCRIHTKIWKLYEVNLKYKFYSRLWKSPVFIE